MSNPNPTPLQRVQEHIHGLAPVLDWLRDHPELNDLGVVWSSPDRIGLYAYGSEFPTAVRALKDGAPLGTIHRSDDDTFTHFERDFGGVKVYAYTSRSEVCERIVVGTEPDEVDMPACPECGGVVEETPTGFLTCREHGSEHYRAKPLGTTKVVVGERDVTEWKCRPVLADSDTVTDKAANDLDIEDWAVRS